MTEHNPFKIAQRQLDEAAEKLGLDEATHELLRWPQREFRFTLPVKMDNGSTKVFHGYRVTNNYSGLQSVELRVYLNIYSFRYYRRIIGY